MDNLFLRRLLAFTVIILLSVGFVKAQCHNLCSGNGLCNKYSQCECNEGFQGADCSEYICPSGRAWGDMATDTDTAHAVVECSNRGICDRTTGECTCMEGFTGAACERLSCESDCNDHGVCMSYRRFAERTMNDDSESYTYETPWDADKVYGCVCDESFINYDCILRDCPHGDDPLTDGQVNEEQLLRCTSSGGSFVLYYKGKPSETISADATEAEVEAALTYINAIIGIDVTFSTGDAVCNDEDTNIVTIEFTQNFGEQPPLVAFTDDLDDGTITIRTGGGQFDDDDDVTYTSVTGTKESEVCSNRGLCDTSSGSCDCFTTNNDIYESSNGYAAAGSRGDCGYPSTSIGSCPGEIECNLNGYCNYDDDEYRCYCGEGWTGGDCSERTCPEGLSWFSYPTEDNKAHDVLVECSNMGLCDTAEGICSCRDGFFGAACEYMICGGGTDFPCSGHGQCLSMAELATKAEFNGDLAATEYGTDPNNGQTWDAHRIFHCKCDTGYHGYDCSLRSCPTGDDPATYDDERELQIIQCTATSGTFTLTFRQQTTPSLDYDISREDLEAALEGLSTINKVKVSYSYGPDFCTVSSDNDDYVEDNYIQVTFLSPTGNLPDLTFDTSSLEDEDTNSPEINLGSDGDSLGSYTSILGTTEDVTCSNHGLCDEETGDCDCFSGWASSNGYGGEGQHGDCGWRINIKGYVEPETA